MFTDCYCTQFRRASNALTQIYDAALKPVGLRITQFSLLRSLARLGQATSTQVAAELSLDRTTISRNVKLLIDAGWVDVVEADDKRERVLTLTRAGQKMIADALPYFKKAQQQIERDAKDFVKTSSQGGLLEALEKLQQAGAETSTA
jgi:DNA-binding MarR family transcriptional regulator